MVRVSLYVECLLCLLGGVRHIIEIYSPILVPTIA